ncbi:glycosyltransferase [Turicibacter bilis]|uniref:Glycosyltransferase n=1 Tax=Turicibacter bilis TaxID=2735723 RepID=A0A9Q9CG62_9FIRM|nr:glycosyltransferase [Turicibacter bilis]MBS3196825.1 glycosyltransferase [Turicibacter bilis]UUF08344.1 glycosyltransferase [Turicibacter bilis]
MKIAMVFDGLQVGGIERVGADYAKILSQLGHEVTIINLRPNLTDMEQEFPQNCKFIHFNYPRKFAPEQYAQLIKTNIVGKFLYPIAYLTLSVFNLIYKVVYRLTEGRKETYDITIAFASHFNDLTFVSYGYAKTKKKMCWLHGALYGYLLISDGYLNLYKKIKNLIVLVDDAQEEVLCYNHGLDLNIEKMYNPTFIKDRVVDTDEVSRLQKQYGKFMVMVSRFDYPHKDQYTVAKALEIVRSQYKQDISLVFVGTGPEETKVKEFVDGFSDEIKKYIYFVGNQSEVQNYYKAAYMLVHASVAGEGLPTIMLEAMAYDLPMVVTDSKTGPREILKDNQYGILCRVQDADDMAKKISLLCSDDVLYQSLKEKGKVRLKDFEPQTIKNQLKEVLEKIINS